MNILTWIFDSIPRQSVNHSFIVSYIVPLNVYLCFSFDVTGLYRDPLWELPISLDINEFENLSLSVSHCLEDHCHIRCTLDTRHYFGICRVKRILKIKMLPGLEKPCLCPNLSTWTLFHYPSFPSAESLSPPHGVSGKCNIELRSKVLWRKRLSGFQFIPSVALDIRASQ